MKKYSLVHESSTIEFRTHEEAEAYKLTHNIQSEITDLNEELSDNAKNQEIERLALEKLEKDEAFGKLLIQTFLLDNRLAVPPITDLQSAQLLQKFDTVSKLCDKGSIKTVYNIIRTIPSDAIYTLERQTKYIEMITEYLAQYE